MLDDPVDKELGSRNPVGEGFMSKLPDAGGSIAVRILPGVGGWYRG